MCRFFVYKGRGMFMSDLLLKAEQSLIMQSYKAKEREEPLNGDGFGVGWYAPDIDPNPCVFTSIQPAWSNRNLFRLSEKIRSTCFFAHVRAASPGAFVSEFNCHPFQYQRFLWMHNGKITNFLKIKRRLRDSLQDDYYNFIQGTTDSEHAFAVFLNKLGGQISGHSTADLHDAMIATIHQIKDWLTQAGTDEPASLNFAVTDGHSVLVSRYVTDAEVEPPTLYISSGDHLEIRDGRYRMAAAKHKPNAVIIASEPLTADRADWQKVAKNHLVLVSPEQHIQQISID
ncbi:MAG: class II glutamine amidotransferase [Gammaproteobacteria bacterium]|jgi:glutamine amidotransferase